MDANNLAARTLARLHPAKEKVLPLLIIEGVVYRLDEIRYGDDYYSRWPDIEACDLIRGCLQERMRIINGRRRSFRIFYSKPTKVTLALVWPEVDGYTVIAGYGDPDAVQRMIARTPKTKPIPEVERIPTGCTDDEVDYFVDLLNRWWGWLLDHWHKVTDELERQRVILGRCSPNETDWSNRHMRETAEATIKVLEALQVIRDASDTDDQDAAWDNFWRITYEVKHDWWTTPTDYAIRVDVPRNAYELLGEKDERW